MQAVVASNNAQHSADPVQLLEGILRTAIVAAFGEQFAATDPAIRTSQNAQFGDFQANVAMALAKQVGAKPRDVAVKIVEAAGAELSAIAEKPEVAGPGFINIRLKRDALGSLLAAMDNQALGVTRDPDTHPVAIDLCGVNVAKQMHVGHLRSTIIGDALARLVERRGRTVLRENHLGDWGLPIAMVLHQLRAKNVDLDSIALDDLDRAYREAQQKGENDSAALEAAKQTLVKLQNHDPELVRDWHTIIDITLAALYEAIELLNVKLGPQNNRGESFYRERLSGVVDAFMRAGIAKEDQGAIVVPFKLQQAKVKRASVPASMPGGHGGPPPPDGSSQSESISQLPSISERERPLLIRKSDGGYLYSTTDLAAIRYRVQELGADRVIYVVDARQRDHFRDVFDAAHLIGWDVTKDGARAQLIHIGFGAVLGDNRKPLKTRSGENVTLKALLAEAIERGVSEVRQRAADPGAPTHGLSDAELQRIGKAVGIAAVKYADLSNDLVRDYVFNMDRMVAFEGNTGPYLQYAHARVCSILIKGTEARRHDSTTGGAAVQGDVDGDSLRASDFTIAQPAERRLALMLLRYGPVVADVGRSLEPHRLCTYLYELADVFNTFYQECPVLKAEDESLRQSRLRLCDLTRRVLADGLDLLGIEAPQRM